MPGNRNDIEVIRPRFPVAGFCAVAEQYKLIAQTFHQVGGALRREADAVGASRIEFKDDDWALVGKAPGRTEQYKFFRALYVYLDRVHTVDAVLLKKLVERFCSHLFPFVLTTQIFAEPIAYGIPSVVEPRLA